MDRKEITNIVTEIICDNLSVKKEEIKAEAAFMKDLGADSLDVVELVMAFEEKFGCEISDEEAEKLLTVGSVITYIEENLP